jgi:hypothetical protein
MSKKNTLILTIGFIFSLLFAHLIPNSNILAANVELSWDANTENDLDGYKIYYGKSARSGDNPNECTLCGYMSAIDAGNVTSYDVENLDEGATYYFSISAYDTSNNESAFSDEVSKEVNGNLTFRFRNINTNAYLFTANISEKNSVLENYDWLYNYDGISFRVCPTQEAGTSPVYRFRNLINNAYLYSINSEEIDSIRQNWSWLFEEEGVGFYAYGNSQANTVSADRFRNKQNNAYLFSIDSDEIESIRQNWLWLLEEEGIGFHVFER